MLIQFILSNFLFIILFFISLVMISINIYYATFITIAITITLYFIKEKYAFMLISLSFVVVLMGIEIFFSFYISPIYYRAFDYLSYENINYGGCFKPNRSISFQTRHGDLYAISKIDPSIIQKHPVTFITDRYGFRNRNNFSNHTYILFGDSFTFGANTDQSNILSEVLSTKYSIQTYNTGYPGDIREYLKKHQFCKKTFSNTFKSIFIVFEGNDFSCTMRYTNDSDLKQSLKATHLYSVLFNIRKIYKNSEVYRHFSNLFMRLQHNTNHNKVEVHNISNLKVAFLKEYIDATNNSSICNSWQLLFNMFKAIKEDIALIVFIPTKYRVYYPLMKKRGFLPDKQWQFIKDTSEKLGIQALNITDPLIQASRSLLKKNQFTYYRDDTHWNEEGIKVAAREISKVIHINKFKK